MNEQNHALMMSYFVQRNDMRNLELENPGGLHLRKSFLVMGIIPILKDKTRITELGDILGELVIKAVS